MTRQDVFGSLKRVSKKYRIEELDENSLRSWQHCASKSNNSTSSKSYQSDEARPYTLAEHFLFPQDLDLRAEAKNIKK